MVDARKGGGGQNVGVFPEGRSMNNKVLYGAFFLMAYGYVGSLSLHVGAIFSVLWVSFSVWGGGHFWSCPPPWQFFVGAPCCYSFYCTDIYNLSRSWRFEFIEGAI